MKSRTLSPKQKPTPETKTKTQTKDRDVNVNAGVNKLDLVRYWSLVLSSKGPRNGTAQPSPAQSKQARLGP